MSTTRIPTATASSSIADILERVLDMGVVIAGDIRIKLVDIELLTIQIRLVVCSIEKAREIGMDWWNVALDKGGSKDSTSQSNLPQGSLAQGSFAQGDANELAMRLEAMERRMKDIERVGTKSK
jgi:hypothetical protein